MPRQVHRHSYRRQPCALPFTGLPTGFAQHEFSDGADQAGLLGQGDKVARRDAAQLRMIPADQRFSSVKAPRRQTEFGLIKNIQLAQGTAFDRSRAERRLASLAVTER